MRWVIIIGFRGPSQLIGQPQGNMVSHPFITSICLWPTPFSDCQDNIDYLINKHSHGLHHGSHLTLLVAVTRWFWGASPQFDVTTSSLTPQSGTNFPSGFSVMPCESSLALTVVCVISIIGSFLTIVASPYDGILLLYLLGVYGAGQSFTCVDVMEPEFWPWKGLVGPILWQSKCDRKTLVTGIDDKDSLISCPLGMESAKAEYIPLPTCQSM